MSGIRGRNTRPELLVRSWLHRQGLRFRIHVRSLPGKPDLVLPKYQTVIFVHGCFWHQHSGCRFAFKPKQNAAFWRAKLEGNVLRDRRHVSELRQRGWQVLTIWECEVNERALIRLLGKIRVHPKRPQRPRDKFLAEV